MANYAIGLDFGTNSCRSVVINVDNGDELATSVYNYPSGELGIITDKTDPNVARQNPQDYIAGLEYIIKESLEEAANAFPEFDSNQIIGIGVDTTKLTAFISEFSFLFLAKNSSAFFRFVSPSFFALSLIFC